MKHPSPILATCTLFLLFGLLLYSCGPKDKLAKPTIYQAINGIDTARLKLNLDQDRFYGQFERQYGKMGKDSGDVRGAIKGDSLQGVYTYISFGGSWKKAPFALLKKDNKLLLGKGIEAILLGEPCYLPGVPIDYDSSGFIFEEIAPSPK
jgi:hypothetical protein